MGKYIAIARAEWLDALNNRGEMFLWILLETTPIFIMSSLWISNQSGVISLGYSTSQLVTYYLLILTISRLTTHHFDERMQIEIRDGTFSKFLVKPLSIPIGLIPQNIGGKLFHVFFLLTPILIGLLFFLRNYIIYPTMINAILFIISLFSAFMIQYSLSVIATAVAFYLEQSSAFLHAKWMLENVAGGYIIPISIFPLWLLNVVNILPFKYLYYVPASIFLGKFSFPESLQQILISFFWVVVLLFISHAFWKQGVKRYSGVGG